MMALEHRLSEAIDFALLQGLLKFSPQGQLTHAPFALTPSPQPTDAMAQLEALTPRFNALAHRVALDLPFLQEALAPAAAQDAFIRDLTGLARDARARQPLRLLVTRSDYLMQAGASGGPDVPRQVELNTISAAYAGLAGKVAQLHAYLLADDEAGSRLVPNNPLEPIADAFAEAHRRYGVSGAVCLIVVQPGERNIFDQRLLEFALRRRHVVCRRVGLEELARAGSLRQGHLVVEGEVVAIAYFRTGYGPEDYRTAEAFRARAMIEASSAIAVPDVATQLAGAKKVQQLLGDRATLLRYCSDADAQAMAASFVGMYEPEALLATSSGTLPAWEAACREPGHWVLKPQREGGGNNLYDQDLADALRGMSAGQRAAYILMERIVSRAHPALTVMAGQLRRGPCVSEIGRFGVLLADGGEFAINRDAGYLVRTKSETSLESGVSAGYGHLDSLLTLPASA